MSSNSRSRRSFKSISSNPSPSNNSSDGKDSNKKRKITQKTLGMAWGADSRSSSRSAFRNSPFSDFGSYMAVKNQKLHEQFDAAASSSSHGGSSCGKSIFSGVSIFVDGYTVPSSQELRGYMLKYGGKFQNHFSRHCVTHIICSNLPDSKIKNLRAFSGGLPVVKPAWVLDSVAANKLLSWVPYQLDQVSTENDNQPKLSAFFMPNTRGTSEILYPNVDCQVVSECDNKSSVQVDSDQSEDFSTLEQAQSCTVDLCDHLLIKPDKVMIEEQSCSVENSHEVKGIQLSNCSPLDGRNTDIKYMSGSCEQSVSLASTNLNNQNFNQASSSRIIVSSNQRHSTLTDPNFVENYFKSSRLHFIGTWRTRYRRRFQNMSSGCQNSHVYTNEENKIATIHIDMDCFFVSVVIRNHPELLNKPVSVCHSNNPCGTAEISSSNYPARDHGVKAGMFVKEAKKLCPQLVIVPYDFGAYEKVADQFYGILHKHCNKVQAVSCDEAFLDVSDSEVGDPEVLASTIRKEIFETTGCTASAGIAGNMLLARLATRTAKPDGQCYMPCEKVDSFLFSLPVKMLPGIGHVLEAKLKEKQIKTCGQLRLIRRESLQKDFGKKLGEMLWNYSRGIDNRLVGVIPESKSVGAEVNWGVRFRNLNDTQNFLVKLCKEVALRLQGCGVQGRSFTLKIKKKRSDAGKPAKYMGCGDCENLSHTITIPMATNDLDVLKRLATQLFGHFHIDVKDIRGMGLQVSKLEGADDNKLVHKTNSILPWLASGSDGPPNCHDADTWKLSGRKGSGQLCSNATGSSLESAASLPSSEISVAQNSSLPHLPDLDMSVIEALPSEVVSEINEMYGGKLFDFVSEYKSKAVSANTVRAALPINKSSVVTDEAEFLPDHPIESNTTATDSKLQCGEEAPAIPAEDSSFSPKSLMPSSLSQVDCLVLQQLPDELRKEILDLLPQHREPEIVEDMDYIATDEQTEAETSHLHDLWTGTPPKWVERFKLSTCGMLNNFANMYLSGSGSCLSSFLQRMISETSLPLEIGDDGFDIAVSQLCDLIKQYADIKIATDIEEIYCCLCLLRRLTGRSKFFFKVYDTILPKLQALVGERYGGTLSIPFA